MNNKLHLHPAKTFCFQYRSSVCTLHLCTTSRPPQHPEVLTSCILNITDQKMISNDFFSRTHTFLSPSSSFLGARDHQRNRKHTLKLQKALGQKSNLNQFHLIRCHSIHYIIIIPLTHEWIFNECNCGQMVAHNCVK